ncbi:heat shock protein beta-1 [Parambassis ranga]|uniref:Heat shock protein beta-1 n=1 Tax=Parambassis ranga TaxID=210632 RepID=A0A6P7J165_9TELE|nr:heat shock protein beta-1-like [Parambassis ranga]
MTEQAKTEMSCREQGTGAPWYPWRKWWQSSRLFNQDVGLPPFLEPGDARWKDVDWLQRSLAACSWPGYTPAPLFVPYISESMHPPSQKISKWRVSMDVAHFFPTEISLSVRDGFLEVGGRHEERPDQHGFISRCFTRKYRLPAEVDATKIVSTLSADGILTVEAPVPETSVPAAICIPIKVEIEGAEKDVEDENKPEGSKAPDHPESPSTGDHVEKPPLEEVRGDQAQPGSAAVGLRQHEERREQEEEEDHEQPAGESHPSVPADDEGTQSLHHSSKHHESLESPDTSKQPVADGEIPAWAAATELTQPREQEQDGSPQSEVQIQEQEAHTE